MDVRLKRIYEDPAPDDGHRVLVDRLWPRGMSRERARLDAWARDVAPSDELRRWYGHDASRWEAFRLRYRLELEQRPELVEALLARAAEGRLTLLFAARETERNNAAVLREHLEELADSDAARGG